MKFNTALALLIISLPQLTFASEGMVKIQSDYSVNETIDRLVGILEKKGFSIIARIDHSQAAINVGVELRETQLVIFGNPKVGSPLMACEQSVAIDLPQKALATEGPDGEVWLSYNDPAFLKHRHDIKDCDATLNKVSGALKKLTAAAATSTK